MSDHAAPVCWVIDIIQTTGEDIPHYIDISSLEVHILPITSDELAMPVYSLADDPLPFVTPRGMWTDVCLQRARETFPSSIGIRVLSSGYILVIYVNNEMMRVDIKGPIPVTLGQLPVLLQVENAQTTSGIWKENRGG